MEITQNGGTARYTSVWILLTTRGTWQASSNANAIVVKFSFTCPHFHCTSAIYSIRDLKLFSRHARGRYATSFKRSANGVSDSSSPTFVAATGSPASSRA